MINRLFGDVYQVEARIGGGAFSEVYRVMNRKDGKKYAAKFEDVKSNHQELYAEHKILLRVHLQNNAVGFTKQYYYGVTNGMNMLVIDLLGESLQEKLELYGGKFSLKTTLMIGDQILKRIEHLHKVKVIHRDLKPSNMIVGSGINTQTIYLVDFGKSKKFMDSEGNHIQIKNNKLPVGNVRYTSVEADKGHDQSRKDDLEALIYIMVYFLKSTLPWKGLSATTICEKYKLVRSTKAKTTPRILCGGLPQEFIEMLEYVQLLKFQETPDYNLIRECIKKMMNVNKYPMDYIYDWKIKNLDQKAAH